MTTRLRDLLGVETPIVLGPFGGLSSVALTAAVSDAGGLGSYGCYGYDAERIAATAAELRDATPHPFALNIWLPLDEADPASVADDEFARWLDPLLPFFAELGIELPARPDRYLPTFDEQAGALLEAAPRVVSVVYGVPPAEFVDAVHARGSVLMATATTVDEAVALELGGADVVVASGAEAAGHRVSFLEPAESSLVGTLALVPQVVDAVRVPVVAAGGIADRRGVAAALALGAEGVQVGTAFLATRQSAASDGHRAAIRSTPAHGTVLTRAMSGRLARGIPNRAMRALEAAGDPAPFPVQNWLTGRFRAEAGRRGLAELQSLWSGQAGPLARSGDAAAVFAELAAGF